MTQVTDASRLLREVEHFDAVYREQLAAGIEPLSAFDRARYTSPPAGTIYPREYYFHLLGPLANKRVLEIACGNGIDASIAAYNGAQVFAYDICPRAVELTRRRAQVNGVADRVHTQVCGEVDEAFAGETFDAIMGYATLHHLPLEGLAERICARLRPGGMAVFAEPVINSRTLDRVRRLIPYRIDPVSDDEQPLTDADIAAFARPFDRLVRREFQMLSRIWRIWPNNWPLTVALHWLDRQLLRLPPLRRFASVVVFAVYRD